MSLAYLNPAYPMVHAWHASEALYAAHPELPIVHTVTRTDGRVDMQSIHFHNVDVCADIDAFARALGLDPRVEKDLHTFHCRDCDGSLQVYGVRFVFSDVHFRVWGHLFPSPGALKAMDAAKAVSS